jgi:hypothetical protein
MPAPRKHSPYIAFRCGITDPAVWESFSQDDRDSLYKLRGSGENARPRQTETCPDLDNLPEPTFEPVPLPVRIVSYWGIAASEGFWNWFRGRRAPALNIQIFAR